MPHSLVGNRFDSAPKREITFSQHDTSDELWLIYDIEQAGFKPDYEMLVVVQDDSVRHINAWGAGWITWIFSKEESLEEKITRRKEYFEGLGQVVSVLDSKNSAIE